MLTSDQIMEWADVAAELKMLKAKEVDMRRPIAEELLEQATYSGARKSVSEAYPGFKVKAAQALSFKVDPEALQSIWDDLDTLEQCAIKWTPTLSMPLFNKISPDSVLHDVVTSKPAMPTLKVELEL